MVNTMGLFLYIFSFLFLDTISGSKNTSFIYVKLFEYKNKIRDD